MPGVVERILVPVDFSEYSRQALQAAKEWAALYDAAVDALHVVPEAIHPAFHVGGVESIYDMEPDIEQETQERIDDFVADTASPSVDIDTHVRVGNAAPDIVEFADEHQSDLVMMSTYGRTGLDHFLLGSVAEKVVRHVRCPVVTMKAFGHSVMGEEASVEERAAG